MERQMMNNSTKDKLEHETPHFGNTMLATVRYQFHYKDEFGNMGSKTIKIKEKDSELAIATFESIYPNIVWRSFRAL